MGGNWKQNSQMFVCLSLSSVNLAAWFLASHLPVCSPSALPSRPRSLILSCFTGWCFLLFRRLRNACACQTAWAGRRPTISGDHQKPNWSPLNPICDFDFVCFFKHRVEVNRMEIPKRFLSSGAYSQGQGAFLTPSTRAGEVSVLLIMLCSWVSPETFKTNHRFNLCQTLLIYFRFRSAKESIKNLDVLKNLEFALRRQNFFLITLTHSWNTKCNIFLTICPSFSLYSFFLVSLCSKISVFKHRFAAKPSWTSKKAAFMEHSQRFTACSRLNCLQWRA